MAPLYSREKSAVAITSSIVREEVTEGTVSPQRSRGTEVTVSTQKNETASKRIKRQFDGGLEADADLYTVTYTFDKTTVSIAVDSSMGSFPTLRGSGQIIE